jgi:hypothetical protein
MVTTNIDKFNMKDLGLVDVKTSNQPTTRTTPSLTTVILTSHDEEPNHDESKSFNGQVVGKLLYLEKSTRPDIACAVHQCARFSANPKTKHAEAVKRIGRYLLATKDKGLIMKPDKSGLECWVDSAHASEWSKGCEDIRMPSHCIHHRPTVPYPRRPAQHLCRPLYVGGLGGSHPPRRHTYGQR